MAETGKLDRSAKTASVPVEEQKIDHEHVKKFLCILNAPYNMELARDTKHNTTKGCQPTFPPPSEILDNVNW